MEEQQGLLQFLLQQSDKLWQQTLAHTGLTFFSLLLAIIVALPVGLLIARNKRWAPAVLGFAGVMQTIPSIALLGFMIPLLGIGAKPAIAALFLYALLPIIRNTYTGITQVDAAIVEAARGMGMKEGQVIRKVQLPLAMPVIMAGIRTATVINVGVATLAAYIAAGGLGEFIFGGIALNNSNMILAGAIPAALLAILFDFLLSRLQRMSLSNWKKLLYILPVMLVGLSSVYLLPATNRTMLAGFTPEFLGRKDGYLGLRSAYNLDLPTVVISDAVMYKALYEKELDVISGYSTDGRLKAFDLVSLVDDKKIFPPYNAAPLVRSELLERHPQIEEVLNRLAGKINDSIMTELNYQVDYMKQLPGAVARRFLQQHNLYKPPSNNQGDVVRIGSKIFSEQYILVQMYKMLIEGHTGLRVETKTGLGGTKICFDALRNGEIDLYPEYTGTGLLVILQAPREAVNAIISKNKQVYRYVKERFLQEYGLQWLQPIGFNNAYALMMRKDHAKSLGIKSISDLNQYIRKLE